MKTTQNKSFWKRWKNGLGESRNELPFFWFLSAILFGFLAAMQFFFPFPSWEIRLLVIFFMLIHILMYWFSLAFDMQVRQEFFLYMGIQLVLLAVIISLTRNYFFIPALFMTLVGQISGFTISIKHKLLTVSILVLIMGLVTWWVEPSFFSHPAMMTLIVVLTIVFQMIFTGVYGQAVAAKHQAQEALEKLELANLKIEQMTRSEERQRIARELHDTLAQGLTGIILQLDAVDHYLEKGDIGKSQTVVQHAMKAARDTLAESRLVIDDLRQVDVEQTLAEKLEELCHDSDLDVQLTCFLPPSLQKSESELVERVISEGLTNVRKHARANHVQVNIHHDAEKIYMAIKDDGTGFDPQAITPQSGHYGLLGIQERLQAVDGKLDIQSQPGLGCLLRLEFPRRKDIPNG